MQFCTGEGINSAFGLKDGRVASCTRAAVTVQGNYPASIRVLNQEPQFKHIEPHFIARNTDPSRVFVVVSSWWQLKPQCDFIPVLTIKTNRHEHFPYSTTRAILHQFVSPTPANLYTSTEDLSQSKPSTRSSMLGKPDPSHEAHESTPLIARPSQAYCIFREPFWGSYLRIRGSRYVLQSSISRKQSFTKSQPHSASQL
jgi:hypothetical protein